MKSASRIAVFGPHADEEIHSEAVVKLAREANLSLVAIPSELAWGKASEALVHAIYDDQVLGIIALDRASSHLAEQLAVKAFVPVVAVSYDKSLTSTNIAWIFREPEGTSLEQALATLQSAIAKAGPNRDKIRAALATSGNFQATGEPKLQ
jgi:phosphoribosylcarboxyaminoimidazole (NCAIR) mutase